jgi:hypothetical protein
MGATAETIWKVPAYLPYVQPPLTEEAVAAAEKQIRHKLPAEYLELLRKQNGGYIRLSLPEMIHNVIAGIGPYFPTLTRYEEFQESQRYVSYSIKGLVPFDGDGHWYLCLDYRKNPKLPAIAHVDVEVDSESHVADSFADYLAMLRIDLNGKDDFVLEAVSDIESVKAAFASDLDCQFDPTDSSVHGYPTHRARLGTNDNPEWVWLSPNTVPRGFARPDERRYAELKDLMPGSAQRFPEIPANSYLLNATDNLRPRVLDVSTRRGFNIRPLRDYFRDA